MRQIFLTEKQFEFLHGVLDKEWKRLICTPGASNNRFVIFFTDILGAMDASEIVEDWDDWDVEPVKKEEV